MENILNNGDWVITQSGKIGIVLSQSNKAIVQTFNSISKVKLEELQPISLEEVIIHLTKEGWEPDAIVWCQDTNENLVIKDLYIDINNIIIVRAEVLNSTNPFNIALIPVIDLVLKCPVIKENNLYWSSKFAKILDPKDYYPLSAKDIVGLVNKNHYIRLATSQEIEFWEERNKVNFYKIEFIIADYDKLGLSYIHEVLEDNFSDITDIEIQKRSVQKDHWEDVETPDEYVKNLFKD
jgi:hypothetical protein